MPDPVDSDHVLRELQQVKYGDSLTRFDPPLDLTDVFEAARHDDINLVGFEFHLEEGGRILIGHENPRGSYGIVGRPPFPRLVVAARKAWL